MKRGWNKFRQTHPAIAEFLLFFLISNGVTVLQMIMLPVFKHIFGATNLTDINFQIGQIKQTGSEYYIFNYAAGAISGGGGGGLAYFLAVQLTMAIAQVINFFVQRSVTFKAKGSVLKAALWYAVAYLIITVTAAAAQGFYKEPIYRLFINVLNLGSMGETLADIVTVIINCIISFWVFFPILKIIFKEKPKIIDKQKCI